MVSLLSASSSGVSLVQLVRSIAFHMFRILPFRSSCRSHPCGLLGEHDTDTVWGTFRHIPCR